VRRLQAMHDMLGLPEGETAAPRRDDDRFSGQTPVP
jgi:hypothetical protein